MENAVFATSPRMSFILSSYVYFIKILENFTLNNITGKYRTCYFYFIFYFFLIIRYGKFHYH